MRYQDKLHAGNFTTAKPAFELLADLIMRLITASTWFLKTAIHSKTKDADVGRGAAQLAQAIEMARKIMFKAPWMTASSNPMEERAAAELQLKHQLSAALDQGFILHNTDQPEFRLINQHNQFGLINPDNRYYLANIKTPGTYIIRGRLGTSADLQIQLAPEFTGNPNPEPVSFLSLPELCHKNGEFMITISDTDPGDGNWLNNTNGESKAANILIRESFMDWENEVGGTWYIERVDNRGEPSPLPTPALVEKQYRMASKYLVQSVVAWIAVVKKLLGKSQTGAMSKPDETKLRGQYSSFGVFPMRADQAVIITLKKACARYQAIQVGDLWFNSLDYCHRQTSLTMAQARPSSDGRYRIVLSRKDPGVANWLDPAGASTAFVFARWQGLDDDYKLSCSDTPCVEVVDFDSLREHLPPDEPHFCTQERTDQLAARQAAGLKTPRGF
ncbi:MAG: hypothetical protein OEZ68_19515 [Gammaproteobacteria bacterium]|nr:hypothetical protein [Gammaproteobacteria bacterium]MDH5802998.1 hypothetical protein [Gammaproteobacteria bacterium]